MRESRAVSQYKRSRKQRLHGYASPLAEDEWDVCAETLERPEGHASACPASRGLDVQKHVPPLRNHRAFYVVTIRFVISTASSRAAAACEPETFGAPPVSAQSTKEASCCRNGSSLSIATGSRVICPLTRR